MIKQFLVSLLLVAATSISAEEIIESGSDFDQLSPEVSFDLLDENKDGSIDLLEASADHALSHDFAVIAKEGKLTLQGYAEWKANTMAAKVKKSAS